MEWAVSEVGAPGVPAHMDNGSLRKVARMRNFGRALRDALRYWPSIAAATLCSVVVATLWGANIGACYPILELTLRDQSISSWMVSEHEAAHKRQETARAELQQLPAADSPHLTTQQRNARLVLEQNIANEQDTLDRIAK